MFMISCYSPNPKKHSRTMEVTADLNTICQHTDAICMSGYYGINKTVTFNIYCFILRPTQPSVQGVWGLVSLKKSG